MDQVHGGRADKFGDIHRCWTVINRLWCAKLFDDAAVHDGDVISHRHGLKLIMSHINRRGLDPVVQMTEFLAHEIAEFRIKRSQRLIHEEGQGPSDNSPAKCHALAIAACESRNRFVENMINAQEPRRLFDSRFDFGGGYTLAQ